jgi:hypothetical protein
MAGVGVASTRRKIAAPRHEETRARRWIREGKRGEGFMKSDYLGGSLLNAVERSMRFILWALA